MNQHGTSHIKTGSVSASNKPADTRPPVLDIDHYLPMLGHVVASDEEKRELLAIVWDILCHFVEMGFGVDSLSLLFPNDHALPCELKNNGLQSIHTPYTNNKINTAQKLAEDTDSK